MSCKKYILSDDEITKICATYIILETASLELKAVIGGTDLIGPQVDAVVAQLSRIDGALHDIHPIVNELIHLQGKEDD